FFFEVAQQGAGDRESALMVAEARRQHLPRQLEESLVEAPLEDAGDLAEGGQLLQERRVLDQEAARLRRPLLHAFQEDAPALLRPRLDAAVGELSAVVRGVPHPEGARREDGVADRRVARRDAEEGER